MRRKEGFYLLLAVVIIGVLICFALPGNTALAYQAWQPPTNEGDAAVGELKMLLGEFSDMLNLAIANRAADPVFLQDLANVLERLDANSVIVERLLGSGQPQAEARGPGWYYVGRKFFLSESDVSLVGGRESRVIGSSTKIIDYHQAEVGDNYLEAKHWRTYDNGDFVASGSLKISWNDVPPFIAADDKPVWNIRAVGEGGGSWGPLRTNIVFAHVKVKGQPSTRSGAPSFCTSDGDNYFDNYVGPLHLERPAGTKSSTWDKAIEIYLDGNTLSFYYEWRD